MNFLQPAPDREKVFNKAYYDYNRKLLTYAQNWVRDKVTAQTIVHDGFLDLKRKGHDFGDKSTWSKLYTTIYHDCIDHIRSKASKNKKEEEFVQWLLTQNESSQNPLSDPEVVEPELFQKLRDALKTLPRRQGQVISELMVDGQKAKDIARKLGIRENTLSGTKKKSVNKLRNIMRGGDAIIWLIISLIIREDWKN